MDPEQQYVDASIGPALQQIAYERQQQQLADQQRAAAIQDYTRQFMGYVSQIPGQVQGDYDRMLAQQTALGTQAQQALTAANPNASIQGDLSAINAPAAQQADVANKLNSAFAGGGAVLYGTGAYIPGNRISRDEAAQIAYERGLPAITASKGAQIYSQLLGQSQKSYDDLAQQEAQLYAQEPKLRLEYQSNLASQSAKQQQLALERRALGLKTQNQRFQQGATRTRLAQGQQRIGISKNQNAISNSLRYAEVYGYNPKTGQPTLAATKAMKADRAKGSKPPSATALKNWNQYADDAYHGVAPKSHYDAAQGKFIPVPGTGSPPVPYYSALKHLMAQGATLTRAQKILNALYGKGEGGRPYVSLQGRIALQKAGMPLNGTNSVPSARQVSFLRKRGLWSD